MSVLLTLLHVAVCILLIIIVLLQSSKGSGLAGAFGGGGGAGAVFGGRGAATFLSKMTAALAIIFMLSSIGNSMLSSRSSGTKSLIQQEASKSNISSPASSLPSIPGAVPQTTEGEQTEQQKTTPAETEANQPSPEDKEK